jgi:peptide/nickel transport system substrate-binding protein
MKITGRFFCFALIFAIIIAVLLMSGCTTSKNEDVTEQTLTMGVMWAIKSIDPLICEETNDLVTEYLVKCNNDFSLKPHLATSWKSVDNTTWEFTLKENVFFSNGDPMLAEDVKFSLDWDIQNNPKLALLTKIDHINVIDDHTVQIHTKEPNPILPETLHYSKAVIMSPKSVDDKGNIVKPIGTGPFKIESYDDKVYTLVFVKNDFWWGGEIGLNKIIFKSMEDPNTRAMAIESGEVDYTFDFPYSEINRLDALDDVSVEIFNTANEYIMDINTRHEPLDDINVRQALSYAINRKDIADNVLFGVGRPANGIFLPEMVWANNNLVPYNYDIEKAQQLLTEAGWTDTDGDGIREKDGKELKLSLLTYPNRPGLPHMGEAIAAQYKDIGISIKFEILEWGGISDRLNNGNWDFLISVMGTSNVADPSYVLSDMYMTNGDGNRGGYSNPKIDAMIAEADSIKDTEQRYTIFNEIQEMVHEEIPIIPISYYGCAVARKNYVHGLIFDTTVHGFFVNTEMYIQK